ncbi:hypothetical protein QUF76_11650 [Desulfobacterales bacterium HSG16]|nr:hypothetical protein [Desulfobacterales bacterium HSG16]
MKIKNTPPALPLWHSPSLWSEANNTIAELIDKNLENLNQAIMAAHEIEKNLNSIFPVVNRLCMPTCPMCPDPCCLNAKIWFDFKDLLFLHLQRLVIAPSQPIGKMSETCRYIGHHGCTLDRIARPWMCTWYLCPSQTGRLRKDCPSEYDNIQRVFNDIKSERGKMEDGFITAIMPHFSFL